MVTKPHNPKKSLLQGIRVGHCIEVSNRKPTTDGYTRVFVAGKWQYVHRLMYSLFHGELPYGHVVRHMCHNRRCINPEHLKSGTQAENMADKERRGEPIRKSYYRTPLGTVEEIDCDF